MPAIIVILSRYAVGAIPLFVPEAMGFCITDGLNNVIMQMGRDLAWIMVATIPLRRRRISIGNKRIPQRNRPRRTRRGIPLLDLYL